MKPIKFPEHVAILAKTQPDYQDLPIWREYHDEEGRIISCWQLTWQERFKILFTGRLWLVQLTFNNSLQPQLPLIDTPFTIKK